MKDESHMFISVDAEKAFDKLQHPYDKNSQPSGHRGNVYCNIMKVIYDKPTAKNILNSEKLRAFPLKMRNKTRMSTLATFIQHNIGNRSHSDQTR